MQYWYSTVILLFFISLFLSWNSTVIFSIFLIECEVLLRVVTIDSNKIMQFAIKNFQEDKTWIRLEVFGNFLTCFFMKYISIWANFVNMALRDQCLLFGSEKKLKKRGDAF